MLTSVRCFGLLLLIWGTAASADAAALSGATSRPDYSVFVRGEPVTLTFTAEGLKVNETGVTLAVLIADADGQLRMKTELPVAADANVKWKGEVEAPNQRIGYFHVTARLSSGEELPAVGSRGAGFLSYMVVIDPKERVRPGEDAHFGMQGGFTTAFDARPYLGIHWILGGYSWSREEADHPGQFAQTRQKLRQQPDVKAQASREVERHLGMLPLPTLLNRTPKWAVTGGILFYTTGVLKELDAWRNYCREVGRAAREDYPHLKRHVYQITWEPVYPWGFPGKEEDLIRDYQVAYPALHETDPSAFVIGPTGAGISAGDLAWNERMLQKGLGKFLDGYSIHPYIAQPPESHSLTQNIRALKEMIRTYVGRDLDLYGTEQGWPTGADPLKERPQALWLTRSYLIMLGEGFKVNIAFYFADYPNELGYGFFHNLNLKIPFGTNSVSPKPMAASFAAMTMLLEGHKSVGPIEWLGRTALGYAYERAGKVTLALWDFADATGTTGEGPRTVKIPVGAESVEVIDWMGNGRTVPTPGGTLALTLGPAPQYVRGVSPGLWGAGAKRPLALDPPTITVFPGDTVRLTARVSAQKGRPLNAALSCEPDSELGLTTATVPARVAAGQQAILPLNLTIPPDSPFGAFPIRAKLEEKGELVGFASAMLRVREPFVVQRVSPASGTAITVVLRNNCRAAAKGKAQLRLRGVPDTMRKVPFTLAPSGTAELRGDFAGATLDPSRVYALEVTLVDQSGATVGGSFRATFPSAPWWAAKPTIDGDLSDWSVVPAISLHGRERVVRQPQLYRGAPDLSAKVRYAWDAEALYLAVEVTDDVFLQEREGFNTWHDDSLQLAFDTEPGKVVSGAGNVLAEAGQRTNSEIDLALTKGGPEAYRTIAPGASKLPVALIERKALPLVIVKREGGVTYEAAIPWPTLGLSAPPKPGAVLGVALTVNDSDDPKQLDPKAVGLFGGITPTKDPAQFGQMVLGAQAANGSASDSESAEPRPPAALQVHGFLGQSQRSSVIPSSGNPVPWTGCVGAMLDAKGKLWTVAGDSAYCFAAGKLESAVPLPTGMRAMCGDGRRMVCVGHDDKLYTFDVETQKAAPLADAKFGDGKGPRSLALGTKGEIYALGHDASVRGWSARGSPKGEVLRAVPGKDWWYCSLGVDPTNGDFLLGSYYPDNKVYRFSADGKLVATHESKIGYAALFAILNGEAWMLNVGGAGSPAKKYALDTHHSTLATISGGWAYYPTGLASDGEGGAWVACAQGLLHFDKKGRSTGERLGGLGDPGMVAAGPDGTVLVLVENNQRFARLRADEEPGTPFVSNANEPWRVGNGWGGRAVGVAWDGNSYLVLDAGAKCLWRFDPDHTAWGEKPWMRLTKEGVLTTPRALAIGDVWAFVLDGEFLLRFSLTAPEQPPVPVPLPVSVKPTETVALAADEDNFMYVATPKQVVSIDTTGRERWKTDESFTGIASLAADGGRVLVADRGAKRIVALEAATGNALTTLDSVGVHAGLDPTGIATNGKWMYVSDAGGRRVIRLRLE